MSFFPKHTIQARIIMVSFEKQWLMTFQDATNNLYNKLNLKLLGNMRGQRKVSCILTDNLPTYKITPITPRADQAISCEKLGKAKNSFLSGIDRN